MTNERLLKAAALLIIATAGIFLLKSTAVYIIGIALPFLAAWIASTATRPLALWLARKTKLSRKICGAAVTFTLFFAASYLLFRLSARLGEELPSFVAGLEALGEDIGRFVEDLKEELPFSADFFESSAYETAVAALQEAAVSFGGRLTDFVSALVSALPGSVLSTVVFLVSFYYMTADRDGVAENVHAMLPAKVATEARTAFSRIASALLGYLRAYALLTTVTFAELVIGLSLLGAPYVFLLSGLIAIVDALPILGAGTVLLPWAAIAFLRRKTAFAVGLLILVGVMYVIRQIVEPRLIGKFIGVHPLVALGIGFAGYRICGVLGMIAAPVVLYIVKISLTDRSEKTAKSTVSPPDE